MLIPFQTSTLMSNPGAFSGARDGADANVSWTLLSELRQAIARDQLCLHYQPQIDLRTDSVMRVEALVRWRHPQRGLVSPDQFIPLAERSGEIIPLGQWVLNAALQQCHLWRKERHEVRVAVNFSMRNLQDPHCVDTLLSLCEAWKIPPSWLTVEITESVLATEPARVYDTLSRLREKGVWIALDDLGAGYASLSMLRQLPVDEMKIDKSFIFAMREDAKTAAIVHALIDLGHALGLQVVAEGVENQETYELLASFGCDSAQGYYVSRPLPAVDFLSWMRRSPWRMGSAFACTEPRHGVSARISALQ